MALPETLARLIPTRRFWTDYFWITESWRELDGDPYPELDGCEVRLPVGSRHVLVVGLDAWLSHISLDLSLDGGPTFELGFDDQAHWHPHVLGWQELDRIGGAIASADTSLPHPGVPLLLLFRFAPVVDDDDARLASALLAAAWDRLGLFSARERLRLFDKVDLRSSNVRWARTDDGHSVLEQAAGRQDRGLYSLRRRDAAAFPHAELEAMLAQAEPPRSVPGVEPPPPLRNLDVSLRFSEALPPVAGRFVTLFVDRALRHLGLGMAESTGGTSRDGQPVATRLVIRVRGDVEPQLERLGALFAAVGAHPFVSASTPLPPAPSASRYLQLANVELFRWKHGVRFDWRPLDGEQRRAIGATLDELGAKPADASGARAVAIGKGRSLLACFPDLSSDELLDGGSLLFDELTPDVARVAHRLASAGRLAIVPRLIAPTAEVFGRLDVSWPGTELAEDAATLHRLLRS